jgi:hypothetical protein
MVVDLQYGIVINNYYTFEQSASVSYLLANRLPYVALATVTVLSVWSSVDFDCEVSSCFLALQNRSWALTAHPTRLIDDPSQSK